MTNKNNLDEIHVAREELRKSSNELADTIDYNFKRMKKSEFGKIKCFGIESLALLTGASISGIGKMLDVPIEMIFAGALITALPNIASSAIIPSPNKLSSKINNTTIKYLVGIMLPYANNLYESYFR